jgi:hypothetical protein
MGIILVLHYLDHLDNATEKQMLRQAKTQPVRLVDDHISVETHTFTSLIHDHGSGLTAGVTGRQGMLTPPIGT